MYVDRTLTFNYSIESYFPHGNEDVEFYEHFSKDFERDIDFVLIGIEQKEGVFDTSFLQKIDQFQRELNAIDSVTMVIGPTNLKSFIFTPMGPSDYKELHLHDSKKLSNDSARIYAQKEYVGTYFSKTGNAINIMAKTTPKLSKNNGDRVLTAMRTLLEKYDFDKSIISGRIRTQEYYVGLMASEFVLFSSISMVLLVIFLFLIYRSFWTIGVSFLVISFSILWSVAAIMLIQGEMNMLLSMLPILLFVIGISDVIHIITKYIEELRNGVEKIEAIKITIREVGFATFLTSLTTAIGFLTLMTSQSPPIREFGMFIAIGVMITYVISITLLPAILVIMKKPKIGDANKNQPSFWNKRLRAGLFWMLGNKTKIIIASVILAAVSLLGINRIEVNNFFLDDLNSKSQLKKDLVFFESNFDGIRPYEVAVKVTDSTYTILSPSVIRDLEKTENYLAANFELGSIFSVLELIRKTNKAMHGGNIEHYNVPKDDKSLKKVLAKMKRYGILKKARTLITPDHKQCRITSKLKDIGSAELRVKNKAFLDYTAANLSSPIEVRITGMPYLLDTTNSYITSKLMRGLGLAILVIAVIIGILFKSIRIVLISLVPNILPLLIIGAIIGFFKLDLKISTGIVFTIAFGIAVDDTIHFLSKLKIELSKGRTLPYAIKRTFLSTGKAIVLTSVILSSGFIAFTISEIQSTVLIGVLICITLLTAVLADLFLLPILLSKLYGRKLESKKFVKKQAPPPKKTEEEKQNKLHPH